MVLFFGRSPKNSTTEISEEPIFRFYRKFCEKSQIWGYECALARSHIQRTKRFPQQIYPSRQELTYNFYRNVRTGCVAEQALQVVWNRDPTHRLVPGTSERVHLSTNRLLGHEFVKPIMAVCLIKLNCSTPGRNRRKNGCAKFFTRA